MSADWTQWRDELQNHPESMQDLTDEDMQYLFGDKAKRKNGKDVEKETEGETGLEKWAKAKQEAKGNEDNRLIDDIDKPGQGRAR